MSNSVGITPNVKDAIALTLGFIAGVIIAVVCKHFGIDLS